MLKFLQDAFIELDMLMPCSVPLITKIVGWNLTDRLDHVPGGTIRTLSFASKKRFSKLFILPERTSHLMPDDRGRLIYIIKNQDASVAHIILKGPMSGMLFVNNPRCFQLHDFTG